jgi:hypothetical protein
MPSRNNDTLSRTALGKASSEVSWMHQWTWTERRSLFGLFELAADKSKLPKFVAAIPRDKVVEFMTPPIDSGKIVFRKPLITLLRNNVVGTRATRLDEDVHGLSLCLFTCRPSHC